MRRETHRVGECNLYHGSPTKTRCPISLTRDGWSAWGSATRQGGPPYLRVHDAETALEGAAAGLGKTLLPTPTTDSDKRLRRIDVPIDRPFPTREIWLLAHADQVELTRVAAVIQWIEKTVAKSCR